MATNRQEIPKKRRRGPGRPFKKGNNANPLGRPRNGLSIVDNMAAVLEEADEAGVTKARLVAEKYIELGLQGSVAALENIVARFHGRPEQGIKLSGDEERPLHVRHSEREKS
ncbi:MAG: hypothetical protein IH822_06345 [Chloroflexi bacterium]|nr:hypothetical protein [Chloroflexota bacterium]